MSCLDPKPKDPVPKIVVNVDPTKSEDKTLSVLLMDPRTKAGFDLSAATEIVAVLANADNTNLELKLSLSQVVVINNPVGSLQIIITKAQSALLKLSPVLAPAVNNDPATYGFSNIELRITIASKETVVQLVDCIQIVPSLFP